MTTQQRGPKKMEDDAVDDFLRQPRLANLCVQDEHGRLHAMPAWTEGADRNGTGIRLALGDGVLPSEGHACLVADEFSSYVEIRGVIVRGWLAAHMIEADPALRYLSIDRAHGFSFENTTVSL
jgi:hypothetical protein